MRLIQPILTDKFECLASKCPANCCQGWNVVWREKEINRLRSCGNKELCAKIPESFSGEEDYQHIVMDENGKCPFLTEKGLCEIHKTVGESYLSYTCREYPKIARVCGDIILRSCKTSCFAVMEMLCRSKSCMKTEECLAHELHAVVSPEQDGARRARLFLIIKDMFSSADMIAAFEQVVVALEGTIKHGTADRFKNVFSIELIRGRRGGFTKKFGQYALNNIVKAAFWEWMITGWDSDLTISENLSCFLFFAKAIRIAADGAAANAKHEDEIFCTMSDIISVMLSEKNTTVRVWKNLSL